MSSHYVATLLLLSLSLTSCSSFNLAQTLRRNDINAAYDHFQLGCNLLNASGELNHQTIGNFCIFKSDGELWIATDDLVVHRDKKGGFYFKRKARLSLFEPSVISDSALAVREEQQNEFLEVIENDGRVSKSFDLNRVPEWKKSPGMITTFIEVLENPPAAKKLLGYAASDLKNGKIFVFDADLKTLSKTIDIALGRLLSIAQIDQNRVAVLADMHHMNLPDRKDFRVELITVNLDSGEMSPLWIETKMNMPHFGGSLQYLGNDTYFIYHGVVAVQNGVEHRKTGAELINIKTGTYHFFDFENKMLLNDRGKLVRATDFLKNERYF